MSPCDGMGMAQSLVANMMERIGISQIGMVYL